MGVALSSVAVEHSEVPQLVLSRPTTASRTIQGRDFVGSFGDSGWECFAPCAALEVGGAETRVSLAKDASNLVTHRCSSLFLCFLPRQYLVQVDLSDEKQKNLVSDYFEEPDEIEGVKLQEAKCFK